MRPTWISKVSSDCAQLVMAKLLIFFAVLRAVNSQSYDTVERPSDAFSYVQPLNTTILDECKSSPPFYPSRKYPFRQTIALL